MLEDGLKPVRAAYSGSRRKPEVAEPGVCRRSRWWVYCLSCIVGFGVMNVMNVTDVTIVTIVTRDGVSSLAKSKKSV